MRKFMFISFAVFACLAASIASANFSCSRKVTLLGVSPNGQVSVSVGSFGVWYVCNLSTAYTANGTTVTPEACRAMYASFLAAQKANHKVAFTFSSTATGDNGAECTALGSWVSPNPLPYFVTFQSS